MRCRPIHYGRFAALVCSILAAALSPLAVASDRSFHLEEATISEVHRAMLSGDLTATELTPRLPKPDQGIQRFVRS